MQERSDVFVRQAAVLFSDGETKEAAGLARRQSQTRVGCAGTTHADEQSMSRWLTEYVALICILRCIICAAKASSSRDWDLLPC